MNTSKNKTLLAILAISLATTTCSTHTFWLPQCVRNIFSSWSQSSKAKKVALGAAAGVATVGVVAFASWVISAIKKWSNMSDQERRNRALVDACEKGDLNEVKRLYREGADLNCTFKEAYTDPDDIEGFFVPQIFRNPLIVKVIEKGHLDIVKFLIKHGIDINMGSFNISVDRRMTHSVAYSGPLSLALMIQQFDIMRHLVKNGADINAPSVCLQLKLRYENFAEFGEKQTLSKFIAEDPFAVYLFENGLFARFLKDGICEKYRDLYRSRLDLASDGASSPLACALYPPVATADLVSYIKDKDCPCCLKQDAIIGLFARSRGQMKPTEEPLDQEDRYILSVAEMKQFFGQVPFSRGFLRDLYAVPGAIKFIVKHDIKDKFDRDILTATILYCKDDSLIEEIVSHSFVRFGGLSDCEISSKRLGNWLIPTKEKGEFECMLKKVKRRNKKVYKYLLNKFCVATCCFEKIEIPGSTVGKDLQDFQGGKDGEYVQKDKKNYLPQVLVYNIVSFMDDESAQDIVHVE